MIELSILLALVALAISSLTDIRKREVPDWLSFSFIATAVIIALAKTIIEWNYIPLANSLLGLGIFWIIANIFYYGKLFAGGDAKLLAGIGAALGIDISFLMNLLIVGGLYGMIYAIVLAAINFKLVKNEIKQLRIPVLPFFVLAMVSLALGMIFSSVIFYFITAISIISPLLYAFTFAVEKASMIKLVPPEKLTEGDWLVQDVRINNKTIKANFEGLSKSEIQLIRKSKKSVRIKYGLPFVPAFLIAFLAELALGNLFLMFI